MQAVKMGLLSINESLDADVESDKGIVGLKAWFDASLDNEIEYCSMLVPSKQDLIEQALITLVDQAQCDVVFTTGGTGPYPNNLTPDATLAVAERVVLGLGEQMRKVSLHFIATAILSRQVGVVRQDCLILNLPGRTKAIAETLDGVKNADGQTVVMGVFEAVAEGVAQLGKPLMVRKAK